MMYLLPKIFLILFIGLLPFSTQAQKHPILDQFSVFELEGKVYISCTISEGFTCNGINILRATDTLDFKIIGQVTGICGSENVAVRYDFVDEEPIINQKSYYRLEFGGFGPSEIVEIQLIAYNERGYQIRPHPANNQVSIYFDNPSNETYNLTLINTAGASVMSIPSNNSFFDLQLSGLPSGWYAFRIIGNVQTLEIVGKLLVQH